MLSTRFFLSPLPTSAPKLVERGKCVRFCVRSVSRQQHLAGQARGTSIPQLCRQRDRFINGKLSEEIIILENIRRYAAEGVYKEG